MLLKVGLITFKVSLSNKISTGVDTVAIFAISNFINSALASLTNPAATPSTTSFVSISIKPSLLLIFVKSTSPACTTVVFKNG